MVASDGMTVEMIAVMTVVTTVMATIVAEIAEGEDSNVVTIVVATIVAEIAGVEIAGVETVEGMTEAVTTVAHLAENIEEVMIAEPLDVTPENLVDGGPKRRVGPADAEISRKAFI